MALTKVTTGGITDATIATADIAADAVTGAKIADDAVGAEHIEVLDSHLQLTDNSNIKLGTGDDLLIYHNGSDSYVKNSTGDLYIRDTNGNIYIQPKTDENAIKCTADGAVELYYDNVKKLDTRSDGIAIWGAEGGDAQLRLTADEGDDGADYWRLESKASDNNFNLATYASGAWADKVTVDTSGRVGIGTSSLNARLTLGTGHYTDANSGQAVNGLHAKGTAGNAGEYGGAISFATGGAGASAIAARQGGSDADQNGLAFFTHGSTNSADVSVEKVRIHHGGVTSFNDGICLGNSLTLSAANTMSDYEEGTWTPHIDGWDTYTPYSGSSYHYNWYVKVGKLVHIGWKLYIQNLTTVSSDAHIRMTGVPFAHDSSAAGAVGHIRFDIPEYGMSGYPIVYLGGGGTTLYMYKHVNGGNNLVAMNAAANRSNVWCMGTATYATS